MTPLRATALAAVVLAPAVALANPHLERARDALEDLQFEAAYDALDAALRAGDNDIEQTAEIFRLRGEVAAALGEEDTAADAFEVLLTLDAEYRLSEGVSPKIAAPFELARGRVDGRDPMRMTCEITARKPIEVQVHVEADPLDLAASAVVVDGAGENRQPLFEGSASIELAIGERPIEVGLIDEYGNRVADVAAAQCEDTVEVVTTDPDPPPEQPKDDGPSLLGHWALWGGVAVAFGAAGGYFGLQARSDVDELEAIYANSSEHEYAEAVEMEDSARRHALFANIGFAAAGGAAIAAAVLLLRSDDKPANDEAVVAPTATGDGVGVVYTMPF